MDYKEGSNQSPQTTSLTWFDIPSWYKDPDIPMLIWHDASEGDAITRATLHNSFPLLLMAPEQFLLSNDTYIFTNRRVYIGERVPLSTPHWSRIQDAMERHAMEIRYASYPEKLFVTLWEPGSIRLWLEQAQKEAPAYPSPVETPYSNVYNAEALIRAYGSKLRYCTPWQSWFVWTGTHWRRDDTQAVMQMGRATVKSLLQDPQVITLKESDYKSLLSHVKSSFSNTNLKGMLAQAESMEGIPVLPDAFDTDLWLLNCRNGTLDLKTGMLRPHSREDLLTKCLPVDYDEKATCPTWDAFLRRIMGGTGPWTRPDDYSTQAAMDDADDRATRLITFLQRALGYSLTGNTREDCLFLLWGTGRNGKSTFLETIQALMGPYGRTAEMSTFLARKDDTVRNDLADLHGARFVSASEAEKNRRLAEGLVKNLTGGERIKARFLFKEFFEFMPQMHVWLAANNKPLVRGTDAAIWERIRLIPFLVTIPKDERDKTLRDKLKAELPGILVWAVRGCLAWQQDGLQEPDEVIQATEAYREEMDTLAQFLAECCTVNPQLRVKAGTLYEAYKTWSADNGIQAESMKEIGYRLDTMGYPKEDTRRNNGWWRTGIGLNSSGDGKEEQ